MLSDKPNTRQRRHEKTKAYILTEAKKLVRKNGIDHFSLRGLAAVCDYSPAALYEYFPSKEEILKTIASQIELDMRKYISQDEVSLSNLIQLGTQYIRFAKNQPEDYLLLFTSFSSDRKREEDTLPESSAYMILLNLVADLIKNGELKLEENVGTEEISYNYWALLHGHVMMQLTMLKDYEADFQLIEKNMLERFVRSIS